MCAALLVAGLTGCTTNYMSNRWHDAADIVEGTLGYGAGAKVRVGPVNVGLFAAFDLVGLRGGYRGPMSSDFAPFDLTLTLFSIENFDSHRLRPAKDRHKTFCSQGYLGLTIAGLEMQGSRKVGDVHHPKRIERFDLIPEQLARRELIPYYTQIEIALGAYRTVRVGFNPGELVDFVLGWTTLDIFNDDI